MEVSIQELAMMHFKQAIENYQKENLIAQLRAELAAKDQPKEKRRRPI